MALTTVFARARGGDEYEIIGLASPYVHPQDRHRVRTARVSRLRRKIDRAAEGMCRNSELAVMTHTEISRRRMRLFTRIHVMRLLELQTMTITLSHELADRGV